MTAKISLAERLGQFADYWNPRVVAELNGQHVRLAKLKGEFVWHHHKAEDELFLVLHGRLRMQLRDGEVVLTRAKPSSSRAASSTAWWRTRRCTYCCSSPRPR